MLDESIELLDIRPGGTYVDVTFGGGGQSRSILERLSGSGRLFAFDQDRDARRNLPDDPRLVFVESNFRFMRGWLRCHGVERVDGILADLGVSSHHFDAVERGFSFRGTAPLDMRMNQRSRLKATDILNTYSEEDLTRIFRNYGEVDNVRRLVDLIVKARTEKMITRSEEFLQVIAPCVPKQKEKKYLAQVYQALRIEVNGELEALEDMLKEAERALRPGGRLVVITYHSLEDRIVKNFLKSGNFEGKVEKDFYGHVKRNFELVNRKVIVPSEEEIERNPRARSAKLRIAEKRKDD